jgi:hypothetical protein
MTRARRRFAWAWASALLLLCCAAAAAAPAPPLKVGAAIADVTGPAADINFMGYAMMGQVGRGLHFRLRSRAFVFQEVSFLLVFFKKNFLLVVCCQFVSSRVSVCPSRLSAFVFAFFLYRLSRARARAGAEEDGRESERE